MGEGTEHRRPSVVLTGFMGTGKTTVGRVLADRLGYEFVDTDAIIVDRHGPIPTIFADHGEDHFRALERDLAAELAERDGIVVSTGGRMLVDPVNAEVFERRHLVVALSATPDTIYERVGGERAATSRPLLAGGDVRTRIAELLDERAGPYGRFRQVATDDRTPDEIAAEIAELVELVEGAEQLDDSAHRQSEGGWSTGRSATD
ncbi:MAG: shikimate kinase [Acidimicrobiaceae bacterium]|nr:shikimate kinase [Acidimicrobiaceae bacterium]